jgi:hypothetical protein
MYKMLFALAVVAMMACSTVAGEVSQATLGDMNLAGMENISDDDGMAVRGAFAFVGGLSFASTPGAWDINGYLAGDTGRGPDLALGGSLSTSRTRITTTVIGPRENFLGITTTTITAFAAGGAFAFAGW